MFKTLSFSYKSLINIIRNKHVYTYRKGRRISILKTVATTSFPRRNLILAENFNDSDSLYRLKGLSTQSTTSDEESQYGRIKKK